MLKIDNIYNQLDAWIVPRVIETEGELRPGRETAPASQQQLASALKSHTYPGAQWRFYYSEDLGLEHQPWRIQGVDQYRWWIVRLDPGCVFPLHTDTFDHPHERRLWVPLQPASAGHVFAIDHKVYTDYLPGDVFEFEQRDCEHGAANFSHTPRVSLQIVTV